MTVNNGQQTVCLSGIIKSADFDGTNAQSIRLIITIASTWARYAVLVLLFLNKCISELIVNVVYTNNAIRTFCDDFVCVNLVLAHLQSKIKPITQLCSSNTKESVI